MLDPPAASTCADRIPPLSAAERRAALRAAARHALSRGVTMVHCMGRVAFMEGEEAAWQDLEQVLLPAADGGALPLRVYALVPLPTWRRMAERVRQLGAAHPGGMLFWGGVKEFADGSLGARTALLHQPYADAPGSAGSRSITVQRLRELAAGAAAAGLQVAVHAIGDRAVDDVLSIYAELAANRSSGGGGGDGRERQHRIEHAQHISGPGVARRMAAARVAATPNPLHLLADRLLLEARLGLERAGAGRTYAFRTLLEAGVLAAFGSDWPVVPLDALGERPLRVGGWLCGHALACRGLCA
jgi:predicted amidohydrolase YtcJ